MNITAEIESKIDLLATMIDYGMYSVDALSCIKHYPEECDENDRFLQQSAIDYQVLSLGCMAYFFIYKDILGYTDKQLNDLSDNEFEIMLEIIDALKLQNDDYVYSRTALVGHIKKYVEDMIWDEEFGTWHPQWV